jgi:hypothetical protein
MDGRRSLCIFIAAGALLGAAGCSDDWEPPTTPVPAPASLDIQMTSDPVVTYDETTGKTVVVVQFVARDGSGQALDPEDVRVELLIDGEAVDNESILRADAEELSASIYLSLVLDASYSMLLHDPPAFGPMLAAARDAIDRGHGLFAGRAGTFAWTVSWFSETIASPDPDGRTWLPEDILAIPEPGPGTATKLFAAVEREALRMQAAYEHVANGPRDHHIMVVFSDGADNYSWFDNAALATGGVTAGGAPFEVAGYGVATLETATAAIRAHPRLTTHVIGLGSDVRDAQLRPLGQAGGGRYFKNPASSQVGALFDQVTREFATIQNHGATIPLPPGEYTFGLRVSSRVRNARDSVQFRIHAGDTEARGLP